MICTFAPCGSEHSAGGPAYDVLHPQKGITICLF